MASTRRHILNLSVHGTSIIGANRCLQPASVAASTISCPSRSSVVTEPSPRDFEQIEVIGEELEQRVGSLRIVEHHRGRAVEGEAALDQRLREARLPVAGQLAEPAGEDRARASRRRACRR
jgi:hypothetical protein